MHNNHVTHLVLYLLCIGFTVHSEWETDEVVPRLLSKRDVHLSTDHTNLQHRWRRSLDAPGKGYFDPDNIFILLPAFGVNLYLNLTRESTFLSGDFVVEERHSNQTAVVSHLSMNQLCFYSGFIVNHTDSLASISTCGGLVNSSSFSGLSNRFHIA
uniref:A disintegrin and metalloproteinase with thrombospondin motifs 17-like n=1 Tax=Monopterus albus TaxID=43700 RepID=UPI0009B3C740|nr:A disintegrin and metalloproteinase with thrombospondin motifs 17-like [Monopterus albus]